MTGAVASASGWSQTKISRVANGNAYPFHGIAHPFYGIDMSGTGGRTLRVPALGDIDNDGYTDMLVARNDGTFSFFQLRGTGMHKILRYLDYCNAYSDLKRHLCGGQTCTTTAHVLNCRNHWRGSGKREGRRPDPEAVVAELPYTEVKATFSPFNFKPGGDVAPALVDVDGDGKLDLVCAAGYPQSSLRYWRNRGGFPVPQFLEKTGAGRNPFDAANVKLGTWGSHGEKTRALRPTFVDLDSDGDQVSFRCAQCTVCACFCVS